MGYYESTDTYPCNEAVWGDLAGKPIRHHQMPDNLVTNHFDAQGNIFPLGIKISIDQINSLITNSTDLTAVQKGKIAGFKILRADRANNKSIAAKGIFYNVGKYTKDNATYLYPNYPYNDIRPDPYISTASNTPLQVTLGNNIVPTPSVGDQKTLLSPGTAIQYLNLYHGTTVTFNGIFQGDVGNRRIEAGLAMSASSTTNVPDIFDSAIFQAGVGTSWSLVITTSFNENNGNYWKINFVGVLSLFGAIRN